jgi:hypothetical protein
MAASNSTDLTIRIDAPCSATIGRAIWMFTGKSAPADLEEKIAFGLEFHADDRAQVLEALESEGPSTRHGSTNWSVRAAKRAR